MTLTKKLLASLLCVLAFQANSENASSVSDQSLQNTCKPAQLTLVGNAKFSFLFWDVYQSELFTASGNYSSDESHLYFQLTYLRDISKDELIENTRQQWQHLAVEPAVFRQFLTELETLWPNVKAGDSIAITVKNKNHYFCHNQNLLGSVSDTSFSDIFLDIWLSPKTSQPQLRQQLLGLENE